MEISFVGILFSGHFITQVGLLLRFISHSSTILYLQANWT